MTVAQLIEELEKYDPTLLVFYEVLIGASDNQEVEEVLEGVVKFNDKDCRVVTLY